MPKRKANRWTCRLLCVATAAGAAGISHEADAAIYTWTGAANTGLFSDSNWNIANYPGFGATTNDQVTFNGGTPQAVSMGTTSATVRTLSYLTSGWSLNGSGATLTLSDNSAGTFSLTVGASGFATINTNLTVTSGTQFAGWGIAGAVEIDGSLNVGGTAAYYVPISGGGTITISGSGANSANGSANSIWAMKAGTLVLNRTGAFAIGSNVFSIGGTSTVRLEQDNQIASANGTTAVTTLAVGETGVLNLNGHAQSASALRMGAVGSTGGGNTVVANGGGTVNTGAGTLIITSPTGLRYDGLAASSTTQGVISGNIALSSASAKTIQIDDGGDPIDLLISANISASSANTLSFTQGIGGTSGTIALTGANTFTNATSVANAVTLLINGGNIGTDANSSYTLSIGAAATLGGDTGTINGNVTVAGKLAPGSVNSSGSTVGTLHVGDSTQHANVAFSNGSTFAIDVLGNTADLLDVTGAVTIGNLSLSATTTADTIAGHYEILSATDGITLTGAITTSNIDSYDFEASNTQLWVTVAPEPCSAGFVSVIAMGGLLRRRSRSGSRQQNGMNASIL